LSKFRDAGDARIFDAPKLFRILVRISRQSRLRVDSPVIDTIRGPRGAQVGQASPIFNATEQQCISIGQFCYAGIEDAVNWIGPVVLRKDWIARITSEQRKPSMRLNMRFGGAAVWR